MSAGVGEKPPARQKLSIDAYHSRLREYFTHNKILGGNMLPLFDEESRIGNGFWQEFRGHGDLCESSQSFALETLRLITSETILAGNQLNDSYQHVFVDFLMLFRRLRASNILSLNGYFGPGYSLLRDIADKSIQLSALGQDLVTYKDLMGIRDDDNPNGDRTELTNRFRRQRKNVDRSLAEQFYERKSGLGIEDEWELARWRDLFDRETHGSYLSASTAMLEWVQGNAPLTVVDNAVTSKSMFMNRYTEVAWLVHRLLPTIQIGNDGFGPTWAKRWFILDESFWQMETGLAEINKKIADTFIRFIDIKFPFDPNVRFK
jgi:hypothetical protein